MIRSRREMNGTRTLHDAVVLATGYRPALGAFLDPALVAAACLDADGAPGRSGVEILPGLFCCGFRVSPTGMLRAIAREVRESARAPPRGAS